MFFKIFSLNKFVIYLKLCMLNNLIKLIITKIIQVTFLHNLIIAINAILPHMIPNYQLF